MLINKSLLRFSSWFCLGNAVLFWLIGIRYLVVILSAKSYFVTTFYAYESVFGKALVVLFTIMSFLGHFALLAFLPLPFILLCRQRFIAVLLGSISVILLLTDSITFLNYHFHLNLTTLHIAFSSFNSFSSFFEFSTRELVFITFVCLSVLLLESIWAIFVWRKIVLKQRWQFESKIMLTLLGCLSFSYMSLIISIAKDDNVLAQQTPNLPLYNNILAALLPIKDSAALIERYSETRFSQPLFPVAPLNYPLHPIHCEPAAKPYNIVIIGIDTWRYDALTQDLTPNIAKFATHAWWFQQHYSGGNSTQAGLFSLFYSLPVSYSASMLKQAKGPVFIHELLKQGYKIKILYSGNMSVPPIDKTVFAELKNLPIVTAAAETSLQRDQQITQGFADFMQKRDPKQPFFSFLFYDAAHNYCQIPRLPKIFPMQEAMCSRMLIKANSKQEYLNHYKNAIHFLDQEVGQVLTALQAQKVLDHTIVIITGDHGEEFNDTQQNYWGHSSNFTRYQLQTPLIVYWPGKKAKIITYATSHYDLIPTLMQSPLNCQNPIPDYALGRPLTNSTPPVYLLVGSYINMGILEKTRNLTLLTSGNILVKDNNATAIASTPQDIAIITQALLDMRKYYN